MRAKPPRLNMEHISGMVAMTALRRNVQSYPGINLQKKLFVYLSESFQIRLTVNPFLERETALLLFGYLPKIKTERPGGYSCLLPIAPCERLRKWKMHTAKLGRTPLSVTMLSCGYFWTFNREMRHLFALSDI